MWHQFPTMYLIKPACRKRAESDNKYVREHGNFENLEEIWYFFKVEKYPKIPKIKNSQQCLRHQVPTN